MRYDSFTRHCIRVLLCTGLIAGTSAAQTVFTTTHSYAADNYPGVGELGYVDGDANLDYVVSNSHSWNLSVFLGTGSGTFTPGPTTALPHAPRGVALGELNGDGNLDAVVVLPSAGGVLVGGKIRVLFGDGAGGFSTGGTYAIGGFPVWVELGHLDGDGLLDIAVGKQSTNSVSILLATGGGLFGPKTDFAAGFSVEEIALGDIEGDGDIDIVVGSWLDNRVVSMLGDGSGGFSLGNSRFALSPKSIALADMDASGTLDVVTVSSGHDVVQVFRGTPSGTLSNYTSYGTGEYPAGVAVADMNADGVPDVVASCVGNSVLSMLVGVGDGQLAHAIDSPSSAPGWHMTTGDLDRDGIPDVVVAEPLLDSVSAYLGDGVGSYLKYCTAKLNSLGCLPKLYAYGTPSLSNLSPFYVTVANLRSAQMAMFIYKVGGAQANHPFQGGTLCIGPSAIRRTPPKNTSGYPANGQNCTGTISMDFNKFALGLAGGNPDPALLVPGNTYRVQVWGRDNGASFGTTLSSAVEVTPWL